MTSNQKINILYYPKDAPFCVKNDFECYSIVFCSVGVGKICSLSVLVFSNTDKLSKGAKGSRKNQDKIPLFETFFCTQSKIKHILL